MLAPASVQEAIDLTVLSFDLAEKYRTICMLILDGCVGQMMEPVGGSNFEFRTEFLSGVEDQPSDDQPAANQDRADIEPVKDSDDSTSNTNPFFSGSMNINGRVIRFDSPKEFNRAMQRLQIRRR